MRTDLPSGTVTFLFTDVEGSTRLLSEFGAEAYVNVLAEHRRVIRDACIAQGGVEVDTQGDAFFFAFPTAPGALAAASVLTDGLAAGPIRVRVGLHTGTPLLGEEGYVGSDVHRAARIAASGHGGQVLVSASTAPLVELELRDLGEHRFKDLSAPERVYQLGAGDFPPLKTLYRTNLPIPSTPFVGRQRELAEVSKLLRDGARVVTLTGPGGTGKTRLALHAAAEASDHFPDGVCWVPLAPLRDPALVLPTVATSLSVREGPGLPALDALADHVRGKELLVVLDNCEQVIEAAPDLSELVERTSGLKLLVTSRETLRVRAEVEYPVPTLAAQEAIALFCERARVEPSPEIAELCRRLDDLPLALELAAARLKLLTTEQLLDRLGSRLDLLKAGRDADPRQQTLRATIGWSHDLLDPAEQQLFRRLAIFRGGCTLEAAEAVCEADLETLESLLDKSLVRRRDSARGSRFWMLETIREYAAERLGGASETDALRDRHADHFLALAEELEPPQIGGVDEVWVARFSAETDNLRAAVAHLSGQSDPTRELRLVGSLFRFWPTIGLVTEGLDVAMHALGRASAGTPSRAKALYSASLCAHYLGDFAASFQYETERLRLARELGDQLSAAVALNDLGSDTAHLEDFEQAEALFLESAQLARSIGEESVALVAMQNLGYTYVVGGRHAVARDVLVSLLPAVRARLDPWMEAHVLENLGFASLGLDDPKLAGEYFAQALSLGAACPPAIALESLVGLAAVAVGRDDAARAARLIGAVRGWEGGHGFEFSDPYEARRAEEVTAACRAALGDESWQVAFAEGAALSLEEAVAHALGGVSDAH